MTTAPGSDDIIGYSGPTHSLLALDAEGAVIGLRILAIYFEVFGTLLDTGLGLIIGGLVTLALVWLWTRKRQQFARELGGPA